MNPLRRFCMRRAQPLVPLLYLLTPGQAVAQTDSSTLNGTIDYVPFYLSVDISADGDTIDGCYEGFGFDKNPTFFTGRHDFGRNEARTVQITNVLSGVHGELHIASFDTVLDDATGETTPNVTGTITFRNEPKRHFLLEREFDLEGNMGGLELFADDIQTDIYPNLLAVQFKPKDLEAVNLVLAEKGILPITLSCPPAFSWASYYQQVYVDPFQRKELVKTLRSNSIFERVGEVVTIKGSDSVDIYYPLNLFRDSNKRLEWEKLRSLADSIIENEFKANGRGEALWSPNPSKFLYILEAPSRDLAFGLANHWERYKIQLFFYPTVVDEYTIESGTSGDPLLGLQFTILQGEVAAYRETEKPPEGRYELLENYDLSRLVAKVAVAASRRTGATPAALDLMADYRSVPAK